MKLGFVISSCKGVTKSDLVSSVGCLRNLSSFENPEEMIGLHFPVITAVSCGAAGRSVGFQIPHGGDPSGGNVNVADSLH